MKKSTAQIMTELMRSVVEEGTARSINLKYSVDTAGKTGTSSGAEDRLFIGYTPYYLGGIWCGYSDNKAVPALSKSHLKVWDEVMTVIHEQTVFNGGRPPISFDNSEVTELVYCRESGCLADYGCVELGFAEIGYYPKHNEPQKYCNIH